MVLIYLIQWISPQGEILKHLMIKTKKTKKNNKNTIVHKYKSKAKYYIKIKKDSLNVELKLNGQILYQFTATKLDKIDLTSFSRKLKTHSYIYKNGNLIIK